MSVRENLELYHLPNEEQYIEILIGELGAAKHPRQADAYVLDRLPFYGPQRAKDHIFILSFNNLPLPDSLVEALVDHTELFPDNILVRWTLEQDLIFEATLGQVRGQTANP